MRPLLIFYSVFAAIGGICLLICLITAYNSFMQNLTWEEAPGTITGLSDYPAITFEYYGQPMEFYSLFSSSNMSVGDVVTVHYPPGKPEEAEIKSFFSQWFVPLFLSVFVLSFGGVGFYGLSKQLKLIRAKRDLFTYGKGRKTSLPVTDIIHDTSFKVNGRSPFVIVCQYHDAVSNKLYEFKSDHIWYDPAVLLKSREGVDIYIDPNDLTRYYMDTSFLPKKA
ncbi:MAG: DUF3592 domain-containing protein [Cyclobacteriaceae bacterium]|nr:DUF3592 domain-containing protein [Cyclobacteriaceae bacterium]